MNASLLILIRSLLALQPLRFSGTVHWLASCDEHGRRRLTTSKARLLLSSDREAMPDFSQPNPIGYDAQCIVR